MMKKLKVFIVTLMLCLISSTLMLTIKAKSLSDIADKALEKLGCKYVYGDCHTMAEVKNPDQKTFDCSGLVNWATYHSGYYIGLHRTKSLKDVGEKISEGNMKRGDIIIFGKDGTPKHTGIYLGDQTFVHSPRTGDVVKITKTTCDYFKENFMYARRITSADLKSTSTTVTTTTTTTVTKTNTSSKVDLSKVNVTAIKDQTYTGSAIKPSLTVKYNKKALKKSTDYTVSYSDNKKVGLAKIKLTGKGSYKGTQTVTFKIVPKTTSITSLTAAKKSLIVKWKKQATQTTGYQLEYSTSSSFSGSTKQRITSAKTVNKTIKNLKAKKKYYVRIRTYKQIDGEYYNSSWSAKKNLQTK